MIIPALDLIEGSVVRLFQGDYQQAQGYRCDPIDQLRDYQQHGAQWLHLVDLTGAKTPEQRQIPLINRVRKAITIPLQTGGGIRHREEIEMLLQQGVDRVVIGSLAITSPALVQRWLSELGGDRLVLAFDVTADQEGNYWIAINGWQQQSTMTLEQAIACYLPYGLTHILCTDISRDGTLTGCNVALYRELVTRYPTLQIQASGGIGSLQDLQCLRQSGVQSIIVGKALLERKFTLKEAITCWQNG